MENRYRLPELSQIRRHGEQIGNVGDTVRARAAESITKAAEIYESASAAGQEAEKHLAALETEISKAVEYLAFTEKEKEVAASVQKKLIILIPKVEKDIGRDQERVRVLQEQMNASSEPGVMKAILQEQRALLAGIARKQKELQQLRLQRANIEVEVILKDRTYMKALVYKNYLFSRKMRISKAYIPFREAFDVFKRDIESGDEDSFAEKAKEVGSNLGEIKQKLLDLAGQIENAL